MTSSDFDAHSCLTVDNTAGFTDALVIRDRYITLEPSFLLGSVHSIAHDNLDCRKMCVRARARACMRAGWQGPWNLTGLTVVGLTHDSCKESPFCGEMWLVTWNPKLNIHDLRTHIILSSKELQQCHQYKESWQLSPETIRCSYGFAWLWRYCNLWVTLVHFRGYSRPFIQKDWVGASRHNNFAQRF